MEEPNCFKYLFHQVLNSCKTNLELVFSFKSHLERLLITHVLSNDDQGVLLPLDLDQVDKIWMWLSTRPFPNLAMNATLSYCFMRNTEAHFGLMVPSSLIAFQVF